MKRIAVAVVLALACGRTADYSGVGDVVAVEADALTIRHDDIPGLMGAMTMRFPVSAPAVLADAIPGTRVRFDIARHGTRLIVTRVVPLGRAAAGGGTPGVHDHTPHHGGVVAMVGMLHLEAVAAPPGTLRVYLSDVWRRPLPVADVTGSVTLGPADGRRELPLVARGDALEATGLPVGAATVAAHVRLTRDGEPIDEHFVLPIAGGRPGAAEAPLDGCVAPPPDPRVEGRVPRCTLAFPRQVTFVAATPDGSTALVAVVNGGVTAWSMPAATFVLGFAPSPPITTSANVTPHPDAISALAVSPDGGETVVAVENRLLVHATATGDVVRELPAFRGVVRALAWSPDGSRLLASLFYDATVHVLAADDGREVGRIPVDREGAAVVFAPDGKHALAGSELGPIVVAELGDDRPARMLGNLGRSVVGLAFAGERVVAAGGDGALRVWDGVDAAAPSASADTAPGLQRLVVAPGGRLVATAGLDHVIRLHDAATGALVEAMAWHRAAVWGLAWAGRLLVSGDGDGRVAVWDLRDRLP